MPRFCWQYAYGGLRRLRTSGLSDKPDAVIVVMPSVFSCFRLPGRYSPMKLELMAYLSVLLFALSLACEGSGNMPMPSRDVPAPTPGPMSTDGPIWVAKRLNGKPVIAIGEPC